MYSDVVIAVMGEMRPYERSEDYSGAMGLIRTMCGGTEWRAVPGLIDSWARRGGMLARWGLDACIAADIETRGCVETPGGCLERSYRVHKAVAAPPGRYGGLMCPQCGARSWNAATGAWCDILVACSCTRMEGLFLAWVHCIRALRPTRLQLGHIAHALIGIGWAVGSETLRYGANHWRIDGSDAIEAGAVPPMLPWATVDRAMQRGAAPPEW